MALTANFIADFSSFMTATKEAVTALEGFQSTAEGTGPALDQGLEVTREGLVQTARAVRELALDATAAAQPFIAAFSEEQDAVNHLTTALEATGNATPAVVQQYAALATQFQNTTKYADEAVIAAEATLTTIGRVGPEQMELALTATTNLASALKIDLDSAASMVAKSLQTGTVPATSALRKVLGDAYEKGMPAADMLQAINDKTGPAAQNEMKTYSGQVGALNAQFGEFNETVGKVLVDVLSTVLGAFQSLPGPVQTIIVAVVGLATALAPVLVSLSSLVSIVGAAGLGGALVAGAAAVAPFVLAIAGIGAAAYATYKIVSSNWDLIVSSTKALYDGVKTWLVDAWGGLVSGVKGKVDSIVGIFQAMYQKVVGGSIVPDMITGIGEWFGKLDGAMVEPTRTAAAGVVDALAGALEQLRAMLDEIKGIHQQIASAASSMAAATTQSYQQVQQQVTLTGDAVREYAKLTMYAQQANAILAENSLFTSLGQQQRLANLSRQWMSSGAFAGGGAGGGSVNVSNTFHLTDTESGLARRVSDSIMKTIRAGTQLT